MSSSPPSSPRNSTSLTQQFADLIRRYKFFCQHIQRITNDTDRSYRDINRTGVLSASKITEMQISSIDRNYLSCLKTRPLTLIICSQTYNGKARFVNELLNENLLPQPPDINDNDIIRMIRIKVEKHSVHGVTLNVAESFELIDLEKTTTVPVDNLIINGTNNETNDDQQDNPDAEEIESVEIRKPFDFLHDDLQIVLAPCNQKFPIKQIVQKITENIIPIFIYIVEKGKLSAIDIEELRIFRSIQPNEPMLFIRVEQSDENSSIQLFRQLCDLGFLSLITPDNSTTSSSNSQSDIIDNGLINFIPFLTYIRKHLDQLTIRAVSILIRSHETCLDFINDSAFDMARDILVTPRRLSYAREKERILYDSLVDLTNSKQSEIQRLILQAINDTRETLADQASALDIPGIELTDQLTVKNARDLRKITTTLQEFVLNRVNETIAHKLLHSINVLHDNYVGTLTRCLFSLENNRDNDDESESSASKALQEILHSAYEVNICIPENSNIFQLLVEKMKELFRTFNWNNCPRIDPDFKRSIALNSLDSLVEARLAKTVCTQLNERINFSHESFETLLKELETRHSNRLKSTEDKQQRVRKECTPKIARLLLESTSLKDYIQYGLPRQGREIGRGQYGVVFECKSWANHQSCVIKSVMPPDDRHWNDLALEFHYLRRIPEHPRIVKLLGSVIGYDDQYQTPVLLIMERLKRDLYSALRNRLDFMVRMRVALDVVEGLRYLHGLGLVHRDIKLKNVLLDDNNRGRLTDLGFCKPEVMMSGSLVGTPIHMAPELFTSKYDHTVDIYAFGILFWYICSNGITLPKNFDVCSSKDILWSAVKKGVRPERLMDFSDECWEIMTKCWHSQPSQRPYLGEVQEKIEQIVNNTRSQTV